MIRTLKDKIKISVCFIILMFIIQGCNNQQKDQAVARQYTCPMHPQIIKNEPGICPICSMDLVAVSHEDMHLEVGADLSDVIKSSGEAIISDIKTISPKNQTLSDTIKLKGIVTYNTNNQKTISSYINGRIEKLYVKYNFQEVSKGQRLMDIYSPELAAAQQELLYLKKVGDNALLEQAKTKIRLLGVTEAQIKQVLSSGKVNYSIPIYSAYAGYLMDSQNTNEIQNNFSNVMNGSNDAMGNSNESTLNTSNTPFNLREGMYVNTGQPLFKLFNSNSVWAEFYADADQLKSIKKNTPIQISGNTIKNFDSKISLIVPFYKEGRNFTTLRVELKNDINRFKIGELLTGEIISAPLEGLWIPASAVYSLGERSIVFVKSENALKPRLITSFATVNNMVLVKEGLQAEEEIAENAAYLIDSESFIMR